MRVWCECAREWVGVQCEGVVGCMEWVDGSVRVCCEACEWGVCSVSSVRVWCGCVVLFIPLPQDNWDDSMHFKFQ